jgi:hypothetical protein
MEMDWVIDSLLVWFFKTKNEYKWKMCFQKLDKHTSQEEEELKQCIRKIGILRFPRMEDREEFVSFSQSYKL